MTELEKASSNVRIKFKIALLERGMKQIELAHMLGVSPAQVSRALAGNITPKDIEIQKRAADILNIEVDRAAEEETTALGAAFLAGLAVDYWKNTDELKQVLEDGKLFKPSMEENKIQKLYQGWQNAVAATQSFKPQN